MRKGLIILLTFLSYLSLGQTPLGGIDHSTIPKIELPHLDNDKLAAKELEKRKEGVRAPEFARPCKVDVGCHSDGQWSMEGSTAKWQLRVSSEGAKSLNFGFSEFYLTPSAKFYITGMTSGQRRGPFISADNDPHDQFWSPIIEDDDVLLELEVNPDEKDHLRLELSKVNHGFLQVGKGPERECFLDVVCGAADGWSRNDDNRDIIRSTIMYSINGTRTCTGVLINTIREDGSPYILTADHCNVSTTNAASIVVYYNYENSTCRQVGTTENGNPGDGSLNTFNSGATLISNYRVGSGTDFALFQLDDQINPSANAFIAGWNRLDVAPDSAIGIHHPYTEEKKISYDDDPLTITDWNVPTVNSDGNYLRINSWDNLPTWQGSSGSPLYNPQKQIIGQLWGGGSGCSSTSPPDGDDYYGRLFKSWEGGGTPQSRLRDYLDADGVGLEAINGIEASATVFHSSAASYYEEVCAPSSQTYTITTNAAFTGIVNYSVLESPTGANVTLSAMTANPGESVTITVSNTGAIAGGLHPIRILTEDGNGNSAETPLWISVRNEVPGTITTILPTNGQENEIPRPQFTWQGNNTFTKFDIEVATDNGFTNIIASASGLEEETWVVTSDLMSTTTYYWRVRGTTVCEVGSWSATSSFTTGDAPTCTIHQSTDVPKALPIPTASTTTSTLQVADPGKIAEVKVTNIQGQHTWISDLSFTLVSPSGTSVDLLRNQCDDEENFNLGFDDESNLTTYPCPYISGDLFKPLQALSAFNGELASGTWQLIVDDNADADGGSLTGWSLEICTVPDPTLSIETSMDNFATCGTLNTSTTVSVGTGFSGDVSLLIVNNSGNLNSSFVANTIAPGGSTTLSIDGAITQDESITIRATDGTVVVNKDISFELLSSPGQVTLSSPSDMATDLNANVDLSWQASDETEMYRWEVATDAQFGSIVASNTISGTSAIVALSSDTDYFWRVVSINDCGTTTSTTSTFNVGGRFDIAISDEMISTCQASTEILITINGGIVGMATAVFTDLPSGSMISLENNPASVGETITATLTNYPLTQAVYDMTLTLTDDDGSTTRTISLTVEESPGLPTLVSPENNEGEVDSLPTFDFELGANAAMHNLQVATDETMTNLVIDMTDVTGTSVAPGVKLEPKTTYFWRVSAVNSCGTSFSPIYQFITIQGTSVDNVFDAESIDLVPNPTSGFAEIVIDSSRPVVGHYDIFSPEGKHLVIGTLSGSRTTLDTDRLPKGVYLVRLRDENAFTVKKLIIF